MPKSRERREPASAINVILILLVAVPARYHKKLAFWRPGSVGVG